MITRLESSRGKKKSASTWVSCKYIVRDTAEHETSANDEFGEPSIHHPEVLLWE